MRHEGSYGGGNAGTTARRAAHNHAVQPSNAQMSLGSFIGKSQRFNVGINQWFITLASMRGDGRVCQLRHEEELGRSFIKDVPSQRYPRWRKKRRFAVRIFGMPAPNETQTIHLAGEIFNRCDRKSKSRSTLCINKSCSGTF